MPVPRWLDPRRTFGTRLTIIIVSLVLLTLATATLVTLRVARASLTDQGANAALHKADADGASTNEIGWRVSGGKAACVVNGTEVASFDMSEVVGDDKIASTDGVYGIRVSHNIELTVTGLTMTSH